MRFNVVFVPFLRFAERAFRFCAQVKFLSVEVNVLPSEKILEQKKAYVAELAEKLKAACAGVVVNYKGINVADDTKFRKELREAGVEYFVVKNTLLQRAAKEAGLDGLEPG